MLDNSFNHLSAFATSKQLGLGWLAGVSLMETGKAVTTDWHRHSTTETLFCLRGETRYEFRGKPNVSLCAGSYLVVPANVEHRVSNAIDGPGKRIGLNLRNACKRSGRFAVFTPKDYQMLRSQLEGKAFAATTCPPEMSRTLSEIERLVRMPRLSSVECGYLRILCCTALYATVLIPPKSSRAGSSKKIMDEAVKWLELHFSEKVSIDRLVAFIGYSRTRSFTLFREHTGLTPNDYLLRFRINRAKEMLANTSADVQDVAAACGFSDSGYFVRMFKRHYGSTPLAYRKAVRGGKTLHVEGL